MPFDPKNILVTGATSEGIGKALALALLDLPSQPNVIITGRRQDKLDEICKDLQKWTQQLLSDFPDIDMVVLNAGIQHNMDFLEPESIDFEALETEIYTNYTSLLILSSAFLPHFLEMAESGKQVPRLTTVTSGLSVIPKADTANYCATKAAVHSLTLSMRARVAPKGVKVIEIVPPLVESQLHDHQGNTPKLSKFWLPLKDFTAQVMEGLKAEKDVVAPGNSAERYEAHEASKHDKVVA